MLDEAGNESYNISNCNGALTLKKAINKGYFKHLEAKADKCCWGNDSGYIWDGDGHFDHIEIFSFDEKGTPLFMMSITKPMTVTLSNVNKI